VAEKNKGRTGEAESREILRTRVRAWWLSVLAGQAGEAHPVQGSRVKARLEGETLVITGTVPSEADRREIEAEVEHLRGHGVARVQNELEVAPDVADQHGLLVQTLMATFETAEQAGFAEGYLEEHAHIRPRWMTVIAPDGDQAGRDAVHAALPQAYWDDAEKALAAGRALLLVTVDETEAFRARELLDEETHSLMTVALPPEPPDTLDGRQEASAQASKAASRQVVDARAESGRRRAKEQEDQIHGP
jgi:hypothetical protein